MVETLIVCGFVTLWLYRVEPIVKTWITKHYERAPDADKVSVLTEPAEPPLPQDLETIAMAESEEWAQDSVRQVLRELYAQHKDWQKVRAIFAPQTGTLS